jgi:glucuronokinase
MKPVIGVAHARAGLLGNPSDGYGGKAIALCLADFRARVHLEPAEDLRILAAGGHRRLSAYLADAGDAFDPTLRDDGSQLLEAALRRFSRANPQLSRRDPADPRLRFSLRFETDIPRQVGLGGSSAIVIAALRALGEWFGVSEPATKLAELALAVEAEDLGIAAGPMDRIVQAREGVVAMDLARPGDLSSHFSLDPGCLPPLFIGWNPNVGKPSGLAHGVLRERWRSGDPEVMETIEAFRELVDEGLLRLEEGDHARFRAAMVRNFELRRRIFAVSEGDLRMVDLAASQGAGAKLCGSGGAVIGAPESEAAFDRLEESFLAAGYGFLRPRVKVASADAGSES